MNKQITDKEFQNQIRSVKSVAVTGFRWSGTPQLLLRLIRKEFDDSGEPNGLIIMFTSSATDPGLDHLAHPDLLSVLMVATMDPYLKLENWFKQIK